MNFRIIRPGLRDLYLQDNIKLSIDAITHGFVLSIKDKNQWIGQAMAACDLIRLSQALHEEATKMHDFTEGIEALMKEMVTAAEAEITAEKSVQEITSTTPEPQEPQ